MAANSCLSRKSVNVCMYASLCVCMRLGGEPGLHACSVNTFSSLTSTWPMNSIFRILNMVECKI